MKIRNLLILLGMIASAGCATVPGQNAVIKSEFIYQTAPYPSCHASTIAETKSGLVAAWFGGTRERDPDVCIYVSRNVGGHWTVPVEDSLATSTLELPVTPDEPVMM